MLRSTIIQLTALFLFCLMSIPTLSSQTSKDYVFINNTGQDANDLHIQFDTLVELIHPAPKPSEKYLSSKFRRKVTTNTAGKSQVDLANRGKKGAKLVKNGQEVWGRFETNGQDLHIESWYWTFNGDTIGTVMAGDLDRSKQSTNLVVPGVDVVTSFKFKNDVYDGFKGPNAGAVINDLHIVSPQPIHPINRTRKDADSPEKVGGVFKDTQTIHCACSALPAENQARRRALANMPEPCRSLCKDSETDLYVVQLENPDKPLPAGTEVPIDLRGDDTAEVLQWWFTENGFPIKFRERRTESGRTRGEPRRDGTKGQPLRLGRGDRDSRYGRGGTNEDQGEQYSIAVLSTPSTTNGSFAVDLDAYASYQELPAPHTQVLFPNQNLIIQALFNDENTALLEELGDFMPLEGEPSTRNTSLPGIGLAAGFQILPRWQLITGGTYSTGKLSGTVPIVRFNSNSTETILGTWSGSIQQSQYYLGMRYQVNTILQAVVTGTFSQQKAIESQLKVLDHQIDLPYEWQSNSEGVYIGVELTLPLKQKIGLNAKAGINANLQGENYYYRPQVGLGLRFRLMD